jgi:hypothetical protein
LTDEPVTKPSKRRRDILTDWRQANVGELDKTLEVWKTVRDDPDSSDKDRIEAGKAIARLLGAMSPESTKAGEKAVEVSGIVTPMHKPEVEAELQELLAGLHV